MCTIVLNQDTLMAAGEEMGLNSPELIAEYLGFPLDHVTPALIAAVVTKMPLDLNEAFTIGHEPRKRECALLAWVASL